MSARNEVGVSLMKQAKAGNVRAKYIFPRLVKSVGSEGDSPPDKSKSQKPWERYKGEHTLIDPPYDYSDLLTVIERSNVLGACIATMEVNVDGFGHFFERLKGVDPEDLDYEKAETELNDLNDFFNNVNYDMSFREIRKRTRRDLESFGNAYWEIIRDGKGAVAEINHVPAQSIKLTIPEKDPILVKQKVMKSGEIVEVDRWKRWRRFVQVDSGGGAFVRFKEFGDERNILASTGLEAKKAVSDNQLANEMIHFKLHWEGSDYGLPRWIGNMLSAVGSRSSEELNYLYFINGRHFPFAVLVSGGMLTEQSEEKIRNLLEEGRGVENAHKVLLLEAEPAEAGWDRTSSAVKIDIKPLVEVLPDDALFQKYDKNNRDKVRSSFRIPKVLLGESEDYNRDTVEAAIKVANAQVFDPERESFDDFMTQRLFPVLGVLYHNYRSKAYRPSDIVDLSNVLFRLNKIGAITPTTILETVRDMLGKDIQLPKNAFWADMPSEVFQKLIESGAWFPDTLPSPPDSPEREIDEEGASRLTKQLLVVRDSLAKHLYGEAGDKGDDSKHDA